MQNDKPLRLENTLLQWTQTQEAGVPMHMVLWVMAELGESRELDTWVRKVIRYAHGKIDPAADIKGVRAVANVLTKRVIIDTVHVVTGHKRQYSRTLRNKQFSALEGATVRGFLAKYLASLDLAPEYSRGLTKLFEGTMIHEILAAKEFYIMPVSSSDEQEEDIPEAETTQEADVLPEEIDSLITLYGVSPLDGNSWNVYEYCLPAIFQVLHSKHWMTFQQMQPTVSHRVVWGHPVPGDAMATYGHQRYGQPPHPARDPRGPATNPYVTHPQGADVQYRNAGMRFEKLDQGRECIWVETAEGNPLALFIRFPQHAQ